MEITTDQYLLRSTTPDDREGLWEVCRKAGTWDQHNRPERGTRPGFDAFFDEGLETGKALTILDKASSRVVGGTRYRTVADDCWEIGWTVLDKDLWGTGANREIKTALLEYAFARVPNVALMVFHTNLRSRRAVEKLGAELIPHDHRLGSQRPSMSSYLITRRAWRQAAPPGPQS